MDLVIMNKRMMLYGFTDGHSLAFVLGRDLGRKWLGIQSTSPVMDGYGQGLSFTTSTFPVPQSTASTEKDPLSSFNHSMRADEQDKCWLCS